MITPRRRLIGWCLLAALAFAAAGATVYLRSAAFQRRAEAYVRSQIENATGLRVSIGAFHLTLFPIRVDLAQITLRGRETPGQAPFATVAQVSLGIRAVSFLRRQFRLDDLVLTQPRFHIYLLPDGGANLPQPPAVAAGAVVQPLFDLGLRTLELTQGELDLEDRALPLNLTLHNVDLDWGYAPSPAAYRGELRYQNGRLLAADWIPLDQSADIHFTLLPNDIRVDDALFRDPTGTLEARGMLRHLTHPSLEMSYRLEANLAPWARRLGLAQLAAGAASGSGSLRWSAAGWLVSGGLDATGLRWSGLPQTFRATGRFQAAPSGFAFPQLDLTAANGARVQLHGQYARWRQLDLAGHLDRLRLAAALPALRLAPLPPALLAAVGAQFDTALAGDFHLLYPAPQLDLNLTLTAPAASAKLPLAGRLVAHLTPSVIDLRQIDLNWPATTLVASGSLQSGGNAIAVDLTTSNLAELHALTAAFAPALPAISGGAHLQAQIRGSLAQPTVTATVQATRLQYGKFTASQLSLAGGLTPAALTIDRASFRDGAQTLNLSGSLALSEYRATSASPIQIQLQAAGLDFARLQALAGIDYPIQGALTLRLALHGTRADPQGSGQFQLLNARWQDQPLRSVAAAFTLDRQRLSSSNLTVELARARVTGALELGWADHSYRLDLASPNLDLSEIAALQSSRLAVQGQLQFRLTGAGDWRDPQAHLTLASTALRGGGESLGDLRADVQLARGSAQFQANDTLPNASLALNGRLQIAAPYNLTAHLDLHDYDFDAWLRRFTPAQLTGHSHMSGAADIQGPLAQPENLTARVSLDPVSVSVSGFEIRNRGPIQIRASAHEITLDPAHIVAPGPIPTDFQISGRAALGASLEHPFAALSGSLDGHINLALIENLHPATHASGDVEIAARLSGDGDHPQLGGTVAIHDASLAEQGLPLAFDTIEGRLQLTGNRVQIQSLTAHTGSGTLAVTGFAAKNPAGFAIDLSAQAQNLRLRYQGMSATGDLQLRLHGQQRGGALLSGSVQLNRLALDPNFDLAVLIANSQSDAPPDADSLAAKVRMDVHLVTGPQVEVATNLAQMQLVGDLRLRGTVAAPVLLGRASAAAGKVLFGGNEYQVDKAQVQFVNPFRIEPQLDVGLSTTVQQYDVTLNINGPVDKMNVTYRSDPPLSSSDIVALLATGEPTDASAGLNPAAGNSFNGQSEQLLGAALNNVVQGRLQRLFGITQVQVNPNSGVVGTTGSGGTVTVQQQVSRTLKLTYTQNLSSSSQDIVQIDWLINKTLGITVSRDQFGLYGIKFTFRHRAR